jgi:glycosylphosphatidylinositol phospholipase D
MPNQTTKGTFPNPFNLADLDGLSGAKYYGYPGGSNLGYKLITDIDFNEDGTRDFGGCAPGIAKCFLYWGRQTALTPTFNVSSITASEGIVFTSTSPNDYTGFSVSPVGNFLGTGNALAIASPYANSQTGCIYIVPSSNTGFPDSVNLITASRVTICGTASGDYINFVKGIDDVTGDGLADLIFGASFSGKFYFLPGNSNLPRQISTDNLNGIATVLTGILANAGVSVNGVDDINGDGIREFLFSESTNSKVHLVMGQSNFPAQLNLQTYLNGTTGTHFIGTSGLRTGQAVLAAKNLYCNNTVTIIISESGTAVPTYTGKLYLVEAQNGGYPATVNLATPGSVKVTTFTGINSGDHIGYSLASLDINYQGCNSIVSCSPDINNKLGGCNVIFGDPNGYAAQNSLANFNNGNKGITIRGVNSEDNTGFAVETATIDNMPGIIIGAVALNGGAGGFYSVKGRSAAFPSPSVTATPSITSTPSNTPTPTQTPTGTPTASITITPTGTPSNTPTPSKTASNTPSPSQTPSVAPSLAIIVQAPASDDSSSVAKNVQIGLGITGAIVGMIAAIGGFFYKRHSDKKAAIAHKKALADIAAAARGELPPPPGGDEGAGIGMLDGGNPSGGVAMTNPMMLNRGAADRALLAQVERDGAMIIEGAAGVGISGPRSKFQAAGRKVVTVTRITKPADEHADSKTMTAAAPGLGEEVEARVAVGAVATRKHSTVKGVLGGKDDARAKLQKAAKGALVVARLKHKAGEEDSDATGMGGGAEHEVEGARPVAAARGAFAPTRAGGGAADVGEEMAVPAAPVSEGMVAPVAPAGARTPTTKFQAAARAVARSTKRSDDDGDGSSTATDIGGGGTGARLQDAVRKAQKLRAQAEALEKAAKLREEARRLEEELAAGGGSEDDASESGDVHDGTTVTSDPATVSVSGAVAEPVV